MTHAENWIGDRDEALDGLRAIAALMVVYHCAVDWVPPFFMPGFTFDKRSGALMADGRRTLADISRAVNNLDRNPTRLLFGPANASAPAAAPTPSPSAVNANDRKRP